MTTKHERFALYGVTFAGVSMPTATMDCWEDTQGRPQWLARVVMSSRSEIDDGELSGKTADGRVISGHALIAAQEVGPGTRQVLLVFHGAGTLRGFRVASEATAPASPGPPLS
jgi:hypothetical protein